MARRSDQDDDDDDRPQPKKKARRSDLDDDDDDRPQPKKKARRSDQDDDDDRPQPKKKKKKGSPEKSGISTKTYIIAGVAFFLVVMVVGLIFVSWSRLGSAKTSTPVKFYTHSSDEDVYHVSLPSGWKVKSGGKKGMMWMTAEKGSAIFKLNESLTGSLIGDIAGAANPNENGSDEFLPVSKVHSMKKDVVAAEYVGYKEEATVTVKTEFGKARQSTFTAGSALTGKLRGYRVTALGHMTSFIVVCACSPDDWNALEPAFAKVIASMGPGPARD